MLVFGVTQPRVSDLVRGKIDLLAIDALIDKLAKAGCRVSVRVADLEQKLGARIDNVETTLSAQISQSEARLTNEIRIVDNRLRGHIEDVDARLSRGIKGLAKKSM